MRRFASHLTVKEVYLRWNVWESYAKAASSLEQFLLSLYVAPWAERQCPQRYVACALNAPLPVSILRQNVCCGRFLHLLIHCNLPVPKLRVIDQLRKLCHGFTGYRPFACHLQRICSRDNALGNKEPCNLLLNFWTLCVGGKLRERDILKFFS
jgi:hypothetical protein